jgi:PAT family acetyl-CoA transporter-like MFS transporter 1
LDIVKKWILIILTSKIAFSAVDSVATLKILDAGVPKEKLALLAVPMTPIQIVLPILMAPYTTGKQPLNLWLKSYMPRIFMGLVVTCFVYYTPTLIGVC